MRPGLLPALTVTALLFGGGLVLAVLQSLGYAVYGSQAGLNLGAYRELFSSAEFWRSLGLSLWIALAATTLAAVFGTAFALILHALKGGLLRFLFALTLPIPHVVAAVVTLLMVSQSGLLSRLTHAASLTAGPADFPALLYDGRGLGVILELVWKETPFTGLAVLAALAQLDSQLLEAARTLGASPAARLFRVTLPLVVPSLLAASVLVFAYAFSSFEVPYLLGATSPTTLPVLAYRAFSDTDLGQRSAALALSVVVALFGTPLVWLYVRATRPVA